MATPQRSPSAPALASESPSDSEERARRDEILGAAFDLFVERGYSGTSMDALADAADSHKRELYRLFTSKKDLFGEAVALRCRQRLLNREHADPDVAPTVYLTHFGVRLIQLIVTPRTVTLQRAIIGDLDRHPKLGVWLMDAMMTTAADVLVPKLRQWHRQGRMRVPEPREAAVEFIEAVAARFNTRALLGAAPPPSKREMGRHLNAAIELFLDTHA